MLVAITAGLLQMAQQYKQLGMKFTVAGTTFFADPATIADPSQPASCIRRCGSTRRPSWPPQFKAKYGADMEFFAKPVLQRRADHADRRSTKVLAENKPVTGENHARHAVRSASSRA